MHMMTKFHLGNRGNALLFFLEANSKSESYGGIGGNKTGTVPDYILDVNTP